MFRSICQMPLIARTDRAKLGNAASQIEAPSSVIMKFRLQNCLKVYCPWCCFTLLYFQ